MRRVRAAGGPVELRQERREDLVKKTHAGRFAGMHYGETLYEAYDYREPLCGTGASSPVLLSAGAELRGDSSGVTCKRCLRIIAERKREETT